jgi:TolA-binding protein
MDTLDEMLIKRRRGLLPRAEERRLRVAVQTSSEYELSLLAGDIFDREPLPGPEDAELLRDIVAAVEQQLHRPSRKPQRRRLPRLLAVAPLFAAAGAAASYGGYRAVQALNAAERVTTAASSRSVAHVPEQTVPAPVPAATGTGAIEKPTGSAVRPAPAPAQPADSLAAPAERAGPIALTRAPTRDGAAPHRARRQVVSIAPEANQAAEARAAFPPSPTASSPRNSAQPEGTPALAPVAPTPASKVAPAAAEAPAPRRVDTESARAMFLRARQLRQRDWSAAAAVYERLIREHPYAIESGIAEMALAKWALSERRAQEALTWFRAHQRRSDSALVAEALWGEAQALEQLGRNDEARRPWRRLLERYPTSSYAQVARQRLPDVP